MEAVAARVPAPITIPQAHVTIAGLRRALGDCVLAVSFLIAMLPVGRELSFTLAGAANIVWLTGAAIMAVMSFARFAPRSATVNLRTIAASGALLILPCFMRPIDRSTGALATVGLIFELFGVLMSQVSRICMGRSFGILRMFGTFDLLCHVLRQPPQYYPDRRNASLHGMANRPGRSAFAGRSRVSRLHGSRPVPAVARRDLGRPPDVLRRFHWRAIFDAGDAARPHQIDSTCQRS